MMKFTSIWFPGYPMSLKEKINRTLDLWAMCVPDWLPKRLSYWIALRMIGKATITSQNVPATSLDNVLRNLGHIREGKPLEAFQWHESMRYPEDKHDKHVHVRPSELLSPSRIDPSYLGDTPEAHEKRLNLLRGVIEEKKNNG